MLSGSVTVTAYFVIDCTISTKPNSLVPSWRRPLRFFSEDVPTCPAITSMGIESIHAPATHDTDLSRYPTVRLRCHRGGLLVVHRDEIDLRVVADRVIEMHRTSTTHAIDARVDVRDEVGNIVG
jgi:hypothetical protein